MKQSFVERAGDLDAERAVRSGKPFTLHGVTEFAGETAQHLHFRIASPQIGPGQQFAGSQRHPRTERDFDSARTPQSAAARSRGRRTCGKT